MTTTPSFISALAPCVIAFKMKRTTTVPKTPGIYGIPNKVDKKIYVGSAKDLRRRRNEHLRDLEYNRDTPYLQRAWNKYGAENFEEFIVLEYVDDVNKLLEREQYYLDTFQPFPDTGKGYNIYKVAGSPLGTKRTLEFRQRMSRRLKGCIPWNKGKKTGIKPWNKGLTAETNQEVADVGRKIAKSRINNPPPNKDNWKEKMTVEELITFYQQDNTIGDCAKEFNVSSPIIHNLLKENNILRTRKEISNLPKVKQKLSHKGHLAWNKGLTKETDDRVKANGINASSGWRKRFPLPDLQELIEFYQQGNTLKTCSEKFKINDAKLSSILKENNALKVRKVGVRNDI